MMTKSPIQPQIIWINNNFGWAYPYQTVISFMLLYIFPPNCSPNCEIFKEFIEEIGLGRDDGRMDKCMLATSTSPISFSLILDISVSLPAGIQSAGNLVSETLGSNPAFTRGRQRVSFRFNIACLCQSIEINNNTHKYIASWDTCVLVVFAPNPALCHWHAALLPC